MQTTEAAILAELRAEMGRRQVSRADIAALVPLHATTLGRYLSQVTPMPLPHFLAVCDVLDIDPVAVISRAEATVSASTPHGTDSGSAA